METLRNTLVVSPHLDDAVFSCGTLLAALPGTLVVTLFAGTPPDMSRCTDWDRRCGFSNAREAMARRCAEDDKALRLLGATPIRLPFLDDQYQTLSDTDLLQEVLWERLHRYRPQRLCAPLGLYHSDHLRLTRSLLPLMHSPLVPEVMLYEDVPYRSRPHLLQQRLVELSLAGLRLTPATMATNQRHADLKARAVRAYASQLKGLGHQDMADLARPERYWSLSLPMVANAAP